MRALFIALLLAPPALGLLISVFGGLSVWRFLRATPAIDSEAALWRFKRMVAVQMLLALIQIVVLCTPIVAFAIGVASDHLSPLSDLAYVLAPALVILGAGLAYKGAEKRARSLRVDSELRLDYEHVCEVWIHKAWPTW